MKLTINKIKLTLLLIMFLANILSARASVVSFLKENDGVTVTLDKGLMKIKICLNNVIQVKYTTLPLFLDKQSLVVINEWKSTPEFSVSETNNKVILTTARLKIVVNRETNAVTYFNLNGNVILSEDDSKVKTMNRSLVRR